jgi:glutamine cyclotransferase
MSDGSDRLTFRDPASFEVLGEVAVTLEGQPQSSLNELECVDGVVWANVWTTDHIVRIDPSTGLVTGVLDLAPLAEGRDRGRGSVLNGIAYDALAGTYLVTGKLWPELFEIRILENAQG